MSQIKGVCTLNDLRKLEVINLCDGRRMGNVCDVEMDLCLGCITAIVLPRKMDFLDCFKAGQQKEIRVPWSCIERIGDDTILIRWDGK